MSARLDLQGIFNRFVPEYRAHHRLTPRQGKVCANIRDCRTPALGALEQRCASCGYQRLRFHSCRDRHCPKCQRQASAKWCERQVADVLPVDYHHVVFTLPHVLNPWVSLHPDVIYAQLFQSVWVTLHAFAEQRLGGQLGMSAILHTWGEQLTRHVHLHRLVPGGALTGKGQWRAATGDYLFPVRALSRKCRGHFVAALRRRADAGELYKITHSNEVDAVLNTLMSTDWVVYSKPCLGHTESVLAYLARYTHRIALANHRLVALDGDRVALCYRDYRNQRARKTLWLDGTELVRRFLLHILPKGFMRIRHYGILANRCRAQRLAQARTAIACGQARTLAPRRTSVRPPGTTAEPLCPSCRKAPMRTLGHRAPHRHRQR